jgi:hypothetical protein
MLSNQHFAFSLTTSSEFSKACNIKRKKSKIQIPTFSLKFSLITQHRERFGILGDYFLKVIKIKIKYIVADVQKAINHQDILK